MSKIIIIFGILFVIFGGFLFYRFGMAANSQMKTNGSQVTTGIHTFDVEVVKTDTDRQIGLTKYAAITDKQGMLFLFEQPGFYTFWMKGMKFPIDILFVHDNTIVSFVENATPPAANDTKPLTYKPESSTDKVLEINKGLIKKYNIQKGDKITFVIK